MTDRNFGNQSNKKVDVYLRFKNARANGLGVPLPAGKIRVAKLDTGRRQPRIHRRGPHRPHARATRRCR
jgi:hypothetical protein